MSYKLRLARMIERLEASCVPYTVEKDMQNEELISTSISFKLRDRREYSIIKYYKPTVRIFSNLNRDRTLCKTNQKKILAFLDERNPLIDADSEWWSVRQHKLFKEVFKKVKEVEPGCYTMIPSMDHDGKSTLFLWFSCKLEGKLVQISAEVPLLRQWVNPNVVDRTVDAILAEYEANKKIHLRTKKPY